MCQKQVGRHGTKSHQSGASSAPTSPPVDRLEQSQTSRVMPCLVQWWPFLSWCALLCFWRSSLQTSQVPNAAGIFLISMPFYSSVKETFFCVICSPVLSELRQIACWWNWRQISTICSSSNMWLCLRHCRFVDTGEMPETFPYRTKALFAFEEIDGVDVCFFGMHVQEYGSECPFPNTRSVHPYCVLFSESIALFLPFMGETDLFASLSAQTGLHIIPWQYSLLQTSDSANSCVPWDPHRLPRICQETRVWLILRPLFLLETRGGKSEERTLVHTSGVSPLRYAQGHIWACPPSEGDDYIFHCHPPDQKIPKPKRLQEWYRKMLDKAFAERILHDYKVRKDNRL